MRNSIVIPTYGGRSRELLTPCLTSIEQFTDLSDTEVIVVCNGVTDDTPELINSLGPPFKYQWHEEPLGYTKACNKGIVASTGEFVVLLNNDTQILGEGWLEILSAPFVDARMAITGPMMAWCPHSEHFFLIGFCQMFRRDYLFRLGLLDEVFEAYGEDVDICVKAVKAGFKIAQVPDGEIRRSPENPNIGIGNFPMYHKGNQSYANWPGGQPLLAKNHAILANRYATNITKATQIDGFISVEELRWLSQAARKARVIIEVGSWGGRSTRALADNLQEGGVIYCVDHWLGSKAEPEMIKVANQLEGDWAYDQFLRNMWDCKATVIPLRMYSKHAAKLLSDMKVSADLIFIDGAHTYAEVQEDIRNFHPLLVPRGTICGHDYMQTLQAEVTPAVNDLFGKNLNHAPDTTIWYTDAPLAQERTLDSPQSKPVVYDCFIFHDELDLLEERFLSLDSVVDRFVISESELTHQGKSKPLYFKENLGRFSRWLHKVSHVHHTFHDIPDGDVWARERQQRDSCLQALPQTGNVWVIIGDADEIPNAAAVASYGGSGIAAFDMELYYYNLHWRESRRWRETKITTLDVVRQLTPCGVRYAQRNNQLLKNGGKHCSYFGGEKAIQRKIASFSHAEYNKPEFTNIDHIKECVKNGKDIYNRVDQVFEFVP